MIKEGMEECCVPSSKHVEFRDRVRKTLYYGQYSDRSLPSLAVTDVAVEVLNSVTPTKQKKLDASYAMAVSRRAKISPCTLMMGILYSERLRQRNPEYLRRVSSSDLFLISMMVASKYLYDEGEDEEVFNDNWAKAGSKTVSDVNKLEMEFMASIDWSLFISNEDFLDFVNKVESRVATTHGLSRGWFTYGDLCTLLDNTSFLKSLSIFRIEALKVLCACAVAYVLSLSLALSLSTVASQHYHTNPRATPGPATPGLTTKSACTFHQPAVIKMPSPQRGKSHSFLVGRKRGREMHNNSEMPIQSRTSLEVNTLEQKAVQFGIIDGRLAPKNIKSVYGPSCHLFAIPNGTNLATTNVTKLSDLTTDQFSPHVQSSSSSPLLSDISSQKLSFPSALLSTSSVKLPRTSVIQNDFVFAHISRRRRNNHHWFSNRSYICVA